MFYLKHKGNRLPIEGDNVFTVCPQCGAEHRVDLQDILRDGDADLYGTAVYCTQCARCAKKRTQNLSVVQN